MNLAIITCVVVQWTDSKSMMCWTIRSEWKSLIWESRFQIHHPIFIIFQNHTSKYFTRWNEHSYWLKRVDDAIIKSESEYPNQILMSISNHKIHNQCGYKLVLAFSLESDKLWEFQILSMSIQFLLPKLCDIINQKFARLFAVQWLSIKTVFSIFYWQL